MWILVNNSGQTGLLLAYLCSSSLTDIIASSCNWQIIKEQTDANSLINTGMLIEPHFWQQGNFSECACSSLIVRWHTDSWLSFVDFILACCVGKDAHYVHALWYVCTFFATQVCIQFRECSMNCCLVCIIVIKGDTTYFTYWQKTMRTQSICIGSF